MTLLALLKHPLLRLGAAANAHDDAIAALERALLRGPRPKPGTERPQACAGNVPRQSRRHAPQRSALADRAGELDAAAALIDKLTAALAPLETLERRRPQTVDVG